jgi:N-terminal acetyltransferase B complex non-catalytic subunit
VEKLYRHLLTKEELTAESEEQRASRCAEKYFDGLKLGEDLPSTELQPVDDLAILAASALVSAWSLSSEVSHLHQAVALLEFALQKSKHAFQIRLMLVRIYRLLGKIIVCNNG